MIIACIANKNRTILKPVKAIFRYPMPEFKVVFTILFFLISLVAVNAQTFPAGFSRVRVVPGLTNPTVMAFAPDGRIFVCEQAGTLRVVKNEVLLPTPFVTLTVSASGERGLIGIVLDPDFSSFGYVYLYYTLQDGSRNRVSRFTANGDVAVPGSEQIILDLDPLSSATNHNGGAMHFGTDGKLYIAIGENALPTNAQNLNTYHGKLLRVNPDGSIPAGNPFTDGSEQRRRVWALGLRNPYTIDIQSGTGKIYVNDVGQSAWEEIDDASTGGLNFGWPMNEGIVAGTSYTNPIYAYGRGTADGVGCAITGGVFFNPPTTTYPAQYYGKYFFMDLCGAWINYLTPEAGATRTAFGTAIGNQSLGLDVGTDGNLYYLSRAVGSLYKVVYTATQSPVITDHPDAVSVYAGQSVTFAVNAAGTLPLTYQWRKNGTDIPGATLVEFTIANVMTADVAQYSVRVTNSLGSVVSNDAALTLLGPNDAPVPVITAPAAGSYYSGGVVIQYSGTATDPEDGAVPASALSWQVVFHHSTHVHDSPPVTGVASGQFQIPTSGEVSDDVWYRIHLTATDQQGREGTVYRDVLPHKSQITLTSDPSGLQLTLDGQPVTTPHTVTSVEGIERQIGVSTPQTVNNVSYEFDHWIHGGDPTQTISTPQDDVTYMAMFEEIVTGASPEPGRDFIVFPNPVNGQVILNNIPRSEVKLLDMTGKILKSVNVTRPTERLVLEIDLKPGVYLLKLEINDKVLTQKLLVR